MITVQLMSVEQLAEIVSRKVRLKKVGPTTWKGLCPVHHDHNPSFYVYLGRRDEGRYQCKVCGEEVCGGDGIDWLRKVCGQSVSIKPDPELRRERERQKRREQLLRQFRDRYPECSVPDDFIDV